MYRRALAAWRRGASASQRRFQHNYTPSSSSLGNVNLSRALSQPTYFTHPHLLNASQITPGVPRLEYQLRRQRLNEALPPNSLSLFTANPQMYMSEDVPFPYHANTDLLYLTGLYEPGAALLVHRDDRKNTDYILCVSDRDPHKELWDGPQCGAADRQVNQYFAFNTVQSISHLAATISDLLPSCDSFHYDPNVNSALTNTIFSSLSVPNRQMADKWKKNLPPKLFLLPLRLHKSLNELKLLKKAASITANALNATMAVTNDASGLTEAVIDSYLTHRSFLGGGSKMAFPSVVAGGHNATILHYMHKHSPLHKGDLLMVDTGCQYHNYCADVSRTWPVSAKFSPAQRDLYALVLHTQKEIIKQVSPDVSVDELHQKSCRLISDGLTDLGILTQKNKNYFKYYPHAIGHYLGSDVHDTHALSKSLKLKQNMVITVEPGIYIPPNDESVREEFRGIGIRIEDDVIVPGATELPQVMSYEAVKEIDDVEHIVGTRLLSNEDIELRR